MLAPLRLATARWLRGHALRDRRKNPPANHRRLSPPLRACSCAASVVPSRWPRRTRQQRRPARQTWSRQQCPRLASQPSLAGSGHAGGKPHLVLRRCPRLLSLPLPSPPISPLFVLFFIKLLGSAASCWSAGRRQDPGKPRAFSVHSVVGGRGGMPIDTHASALQRRPNHLTPTTALSLSLSLFIFPTG